MSKAKAIQRKYLKHMKFKSYKKNHKKLIYPIAVQCVPKNGMRVMVEILLEGAALPTVKIFDESQREITKLYPHIKRELLKVKDSIIFDGYIRQKDMKSRYLDSELYIIDFCINTPYGIRVGLIEPTLLPIAADTVNQVFRTSCIKRCPALILEKPEDFGRMLYETILPDAPMEYDYLFRDLDAPYEHKYTNGVLLYDY
jgi:hypothetical protein